MTTDDFTDAARAVGVNPEEVRESVRNATEYASFNGMSDAEFLLWIWHAGAIYGREYLAAQEPTDAEVEAAARAMRIETLGDTVRPGNAARWWDNGDVSPDEADKLRRLARAALSAARAARRDEEKR